MRIEIVVDVPDIHDMGAVDAVDLGRDVARRVSNDLHGITATLVHCAVGSAEDIIVRRDYEPDLPVHASYVEREAPETVTPHNEDRDDNTVTAYNVDEPELEDEVDEDAEDFQFTPTEEDEEDGEEDTAPAPESER